MATVTIRFIVLFFRLQVSLLGKATFLNTPWPTFTQCPGPCKCFDHTVVANDLLECQHLSYTVIVAIGVC